MRNRHHVPPRSPRDIEKELNNQKNIRLFLTGKEQELKYQEKEERVYTPEQERFGMGRPDPVLDMLNKIYDRLGQILERMK